MVGDIDSLFSKAAGRMKRSAIRELLKLVQKPDIISFAGGLPAPESFPIEDLKVIINDMMNKEGEVALQYGATEGDLLLRKLLVERYQKQGLKLELDNLIITTASQQALDLLPKIFIDPGDVVLCGLPSYLGALQSFVNYGARLEGVPLDEKGMNAGLLEKKCAALKAEGIRPKFLYVIPDFQNPAGVTMPASRRKEIIAVAQKYDLLILEDSPYREIRFAGEPQPTIYELADPGRVVLLGTFSKTFAPGFRIGWIIADTKIVDKVVMSKQSADLCTPPFVQRIAARYLEKGLFDKNLSAIVQNYKEKRQIMIDSFKKYFPAGVSWTEPEGGLFLLVTLPEYMDAEELFKIAIEEKVAFVLGTSFYCDGGGKNTFRCNFSYMSKEKNEEGVKRLANAIKKLMK